MHFIERLMAWFMKAKKAAPRPFPPVFLLLSCISYLFTGRDNRSSTHTEGRNVLLFPLFYSKPIIKKVNFNNK